MISKTSPTLSNRKMTTCRSKWLVLLASGVLVAPGAASAQKIGASADSVAVRPDSTLARVHVVRAGETLWSLAATYLGDARWWRELLLLNRAVLHDAQHLEPGTRLVLPGRARAPSTMRVANGRATLPVASIGDDHDARFEGRTVFFGSKHTGLASRDQQSADAASQHADTLGSGIFQLSRAPSTLALAAPIAPSASMHASSSRARMPSIWERVAAPWIDVMGGPLLAGRILRGIDTPAVVAAEGASDLHLFDVVHITPPQGAPTLVGTRYLAFRLGQILLGHGQVVIPVGIVRVDRVGSGDSRAQATLVAKFSAVAEGVGLVLLDVGDATDSSTTRQISPRSLFPPSSHSSSRSPRTLHTQS